MTDRIAVTKTYKLYINGAFPRSESGRTIPVLDKKDRLYCYVCRASRKDLRNAVEAADKAKNAWANRTAYNRGQILYRMAEMLEGKIDEFAHAIALTGDGGVRNAKKEIEASIDRLIAYGGWADKYAQILGCNNPVAGPFYNFTIPNPTGVVGVITPDEQPLLGLISLIASVLCSGNTIVVLGSDAHPLASAILGEVCATSDVPIGVINILTGDRAELVSHFAEHRGISSIHAANLSKDEAECLRLGTCENVKRVHIRNIKSDQWYDTLDMHSPWWIEPFVEMKTIWHPAKI